MHELFECNFFIVIVVLMIFFTLKKKNLYTIMQNIDRV